MTYEPFKDPDNLRMFTINWAQLRGRFEIADDGTVTFFAESAGTAAYILDIGDAPPSFYTLDFKAPHGAMISSSDVLTVLPDKVLWKKVENGEIETHDA